MFGPVLHSSSTTSNSLATNVDEMKLNLGSNNSSISSPSPSPAASRIIPLSTKAVIGMPNRPGFGSVGKKIMVRTNHFAVQTIDSDIHQYDVKITPDVTSKKVCRDIMNTLIDSYMDSHLGKKLPAYDGSKSIFTAGPFPFTSSTDFVVKLLDKDEPTRKERQFKVTIKFAAKTDLYQLHEYLQRKKRDLPQESLQALDIVLSSTPSVKYTSVGKSFFSPSLAQKGTLEDGLEYWVGFYQSLRPTQMGLSLNIDMSATAFLDPIIVTDFIHQYFHIRDLSRTLSDIDRIKISNTLSGVRVQLTHLENVRRKKIGSLSQQPIGQLMFTDTNIGQRRSVVQYYLQEYGVKIKYPSLPAIQCGSDPKPMYLPLELCKIVEGQKYTRKLNDKHVANLLKATCQRPKLREQSIRQMVMRNGYNNDQYVKEFGMRISHEPKMVEARVLPPPMINYRGSQEIPRVGQWNMINKRLFDAAKVDFWTCVNFSRLNEDQVDQFCWELVEMCRSKGLTFNPDPLIPIHSAQSNCIRDALKNIYRGCKEQLTKMKTTDKHLQLLIVILPDNSNSYGKIKRICDTELGIVSQCCRPKNALKMNKQYLENITLKINVKAGGRNAVLTLAAEKRLAFVSDMPTIIFGADVTHPCAGEDSSCSIAAVVASMDWPEVTRYKGLVSAQERRVEIISDLYKEVQDPVKGKIYSGMIRELLISFKRSTGYKPARIIFYRDGVSDGQFNHVLLYEVDAIRKACYSLEGGYQPRITFVVVQKRHHTRLFPNIHDDKNTSDRSGNIFPGTVVDTDICHPREFDFYLCSHAGIQGTSRPTHYHVLYDENGFTADGLQGLTNNLCYTYVRCTRSVSIVPPAYYAHLAASRARYYLEDDAGSSSGAGVRPLPTIMDNVKEVMFYC